MIAAKLNVLFQDEGHQRAHCMLMAYGFLFEVIPPDMLVGRLYSHPAKLLQVELFNADGEFWSVIRDMSKPLQQQVIADESYSEKEWTWLEDADDHEFLRRELHILLEIRPHYMTRLPS